MRYLCLDRYRYMALEKEGHKEHGSDCWCMNEVNDGKNDHHPLAARPPSVGGVLR